jgi:hypothetical protein
LLLPLLLTLFIVYYIIYYAAVLSSFYKDGTFIKSEKPNLDSNKNIEEELRDEDDQGDDEENEFDDSFPEEDPEEDPEEEPDKNSSKKQDWGLILGRKGKNIFVHQLANTQINSGKPVTLKVLNEVLAYSNVLVSEDTLNSLLAIPRLVFYDLHKKETLDLIYDKLGSPYSKTQPQGVYIFTCLKTNQKYVGSSSQLPFRLKGYLNETHRTTGKLIPLMKEVGLSEFKLEVICLPYYPEFKSELVLEQYFLLDPSFSLNTIRVPNNPSGSNFKPLFMYNRDKSILYYYTTQQKDFISKLSVSHSTFTKHLTKGTYYLGKYLFTRENNNRAKQSLMTLPEIALMLKRDRVKYNRENPIKGLNKAIILVDVNSQEEFLFESLGQCIRYLKDKGFSASQSTLVKRLNTDLSYKGYICKTVRASALNKYLRR